MCRRRNNQRTTKAGRCHCRGEPDTGYKENDTIANDNKEEGRIYVEY